MANNESIGQTLVSPESLASSTDTSESSDWLTLTQVDWESVSSDGFSAWAQEKGKTLSFDRYAEYYEQYASQCSENGDLEVEIQVRRSRDDLQYAISASYGTLSSKVLDTDDFSESVSVEGESSIDLEASLLGMLHASWEGAVYDGDGGQIVPTPTIENDGAVVSFWKNGALIVVYGTLRLSYTEQYDTYILTIAPRDEGTYDADDLSTAYQSTVNAVYSGGVASLEISLPDMTGYCDGGSNLIVDPDDDDPDGGDQCYDLYVTRHKCTNEIISQELVAVSCPEEE